MSWLTNSRSWSFRSRAISTAARTISCCSSDGTFSSFSRRTTSPSSCDARYSLKIERRDERSSETAATATRPRRRALTSSRTRRTASELRSSGGQLKFAGSSRSRIASARKWASRSGAAGVSRRTSSRDSRSDVNPSTICADVRRPRLCNESNRTAIISRSRPALSIASMTPRLTTWKWNCGLDISRIQRVASTMSPPLKNSRRHRSSVSLN
mmetsp:Transcript_47861/g.107855  ORF Transcript_47861/g.107855 Transcript_47861/m.107855 type:complete len:212 (+) Transcript_47861:1351-1986(+)